MKAAVVPAASSAWQIQDVVQPEPGPGQVLVKMHASGICYQAKLVCHGLRASLRLDDASVISIKTASQIKLASATSRA